MDVSTQKDLEEVQEAGVGIGYWNGQNSVESRSQNKRQQAGNSKKKPNFRRLHRLIVQMFLMAPIKL